MVFENIFSAEGTINNLFIAACLLVLGIFLGFIWRIFMTKFLKNSFYPWIRKNSTNSYKRIYSITKMMVIVIQWIIILYFLIQSAAVFHINIIDKITNVFLSFSPKIILSFIILIVGLIVANVSSNKIDGRKFPYNHLFSSLLEIIIVIATILACLEVLGLKLTSFNYIFIALLAGIVLAFAIAIGIAFGLAFKPEVTKLISEMKKKN
jgi:uncharacterized protein YacL